MMSIYSAFYNVERMQFPWRQTLANWLAFCNGREQIVIAINTSDDDSSVKVREWVARWQGENPHSQTRIDIVDTAIPYENPAFDGLIKAAALSHCVEPFAVLLDCDEALIPRQRRLWLTLAAELERSPYDAFLIPVVDLIGDEKRYKSVGSKFYLHRNLPTITRGIVRHARRADGCMDTDVSDSTEAIYKETGELVRATAIVSPAFPPYMLVGQLEGGEVPFVTHLGWLSAEQRLRQSAFWRPVWTARRAGENPEPELTLAALEAIPRYRHNLPSWKDGTT